MKKEADSRWTVHLSEPCVTLETQGPKVDLSQVPHEALFDGSYCTVKLMIQNPQICLSGVSSE